ncbi:MAG TPA: hypothetical protein VG621_00805 [Candidatus Paceibacterota bacterium]|nr:hypothetical protein [Candidatus Paceibacterota bacterium]
MKIDLKKPDVPLQIADLQKLLQTTTPTEKELVLALLFTIVIFHENRPRELHKLLHNHCISGTTCHNPTSDKTGKTLRGVCRAEITIDHRNGTTLTIQHEVMQNGYLKAILKGGKEKTVVIAANIFTRRDGNIEPISITITGDTAASILEELHNLLKEPVELLYAVVTKNGLV